MTKPMPCAPRDERRDFDSPCVVLRQGQLTDFAAAVRAHHSAIRGRPLVAPATFGPARTEPAVRSCRRPSATALLSRRAPRPLTPSRPLWSARVGGCRVVCVLYAVGGLRRSPDSVERTSRRLDDHEPTGEVSRLRDCRSIRRALIKVRDIVGERSPTARTTRTTHVPELTPLPAGRESSVFSKSRRSRHVRVAQAQPCQRSASRSDWFEVPIRPSRSKIAVSVMAVPSV